VYKCVVTLCIYIYSPSIRRCYCIDSVEGKVDSWALELLCLFYRQSSMNNVIGCFSLKCLFPLDPVCTESRRDKKLER